MEEETVQEEQMAQFLPPMVELFIHNGSIEVQQVPTPQGMMTLLRFHTPAIVFTIRLDEGGVDAVVEALKGSGTPRIQIAGANEVPKLRG